VLKKTDVEKLMSMSDLLAQAKAGHAQFKAIWRAIAKDGGCDEWGTMECSRVYQEYQDFLIMQTEMFIRWRANIVPAAPAPHDAISYDGDVGDEPTSGCDLSNPLPE
jgi:hypothetical protein